MVAHITIERMLTITARFPKVFYSVKVMVEFQTDEHGVGGEDVLEFSIIFLDQDLTIGIFILLCFILTFKSQVIYIFFDV